MEQKKEKTKPIIDKRYIVKRLNTIEGQVRGVSSMVVENRTCDEILIQIASVCNSLRSVGKNVLRLYLESSIVDKIDKGHLEVLDEVMELFERLK